MEVKNAPNYTTNQEEALSNHEIFNALVYTRCRDALEQLEKRQNDPRLNAYLAKLLPNGIPPKMHNKKNIVLFRHIATSNYETHRFVSVADAFDSLTPLILEYTEDKFNDRNEGKYFLGKLCFHKGMNKKGDAIWESERIIDFNGSNNKPISSVKTLWGESLVDFHHELFWKRFPQLKDNVEDVSLWLREFGPAAKDYYKPFLALFLRDGILFENFLLEKDEFGFTKDVILPAFVEVMEESGVKPLVVALEPTNIEGDRFWSSHAYQDKAFIEQKILLASATIKPI